MIERAIYSILSTDPAVAALVDDRIYPREMRLGADFPAIVYQRIFTGPEQASGATIPLRMALIQISCFDRFAEPYRGASELAVAVKSALDRFTGTAAGVVIQDALLRDERDTYEDKSDKSGRALDYDVWYEES